MKKNTLIADIMQIKRELFRMRFDRNMAINELLEALAVFVIITKANNKICILHGLFTLLLMSYYWHYIIKYFSKA